MRKMLPNSTFGRIYLSNALNGGHKNATIGKLVFLQSQT